MMIVWNDGDECIIVMDKGKKGEIFGVLDLDIIDVIELYNKLNKILDKRGLIE